MSFPLLLPPTRTSETFVYVVCQSGIDLHAPTPGAATCSAGQCKTHLPVHVRSAVSLSTPSPPSSVSTRPLSLECTHVQSPCRTCTRACLRRVYDMTWHVISSFDMPGLQNSKTRGACFRELKAACTWIRESVPTWEPSGPAKQRHGCQPLVDTGPLPKPYWTELSENDGPSLTVKRTW
jgi:hypothetical protein